MNINLPTNTGTIGSLAILNGLYVSKIGTSCLSGTVEFYGDSITAGTGLSAANTQRFSYLLAQQYGFTELNTAVSGDMTQDMVNKVYNNHVPGSTCVVKIGYNDCNFSTYSDSTMYISYDTFMANLLYLSLSSSQLVSNRGTNTVRTGTWYTSIFTNGGSYAKTLGATVTANVTGRYIGFFITTLATTSSINISIDGGTAVPLTTYTVPVTSNSGNFGNICYFYDTGTSGAHTILVTITTSDPNALSIEWFYGFDSLSTATNSSVIVMGMEPNNFQSSGSAGTVARRETINKFQKRISNDFRLRFGAKVTFCSGGTFSWGNKCADTVHPDLHGHAKLRDDVISTLVNGESFSF